MGVEADRLLEFSLSFAAAALEAAVAFLVMRFVLVRGLDVLLVRAITLDCVGVC